MDDLPEISERGVLYPRRLPHRFQRIPAAGSVSELVEWWWIAEWAMPPGTTSRQELLAFPGCNLVVEPGMVGFSGPATRASHRDLVGSGWAVAALLRPAAVPAFTSDPASLRDSYVPLSAPELQSAVAEAMVAGTNSSVVLAGNQASALKVSMRTVHRLAEQHIGLTPHALIRR